MKLLQFKHEDKVRLGIATDQGVLDVNEASAKFQIEVANNIDRLIDAGDKGMEALRKLIEQASGVSELFLKEDEIEYLPVISHPEKIICVGLNYKPHVEESNMELPSSPVLFSKFNNALAAHNQNIKLPSVAKKFDYEAELVMIIGKTAENVKEENALSYVFGYSAGNDLSARDLQLKTGQWLIGKTLNHFAPVGPYLVTADEIDPSNLDIQCKVNGEVRQSNNTKNMIFNCATLISYISQHMTLKPGDVIFTGTPEGVILGYPEDEQVWLKSGDKVEVSIEKIGTLKNTLI